MPWVFVVGCLVTIGYLIIAFNDSPPLSPAPASAPAGFADANPRGAPSQQEETALAPAPPPSGTAPPAGEYVASDETDRPRFIPKVAAPAVPDALPGPPVDSQTQVAMIPNGAAPVAADLPALAPVRVVLTFARGDAAGAKRAADILQALAAVGVEVAGLVPADAHHASPGIGYYFRSDRDAALGVGRRLEALLGAGEPLVHQLRGSVPPPGTIEIAVP